MIENLLKEQAGQINSLLSKYGLSEAQASGATDSILKSISGFFTSQAKSGNLDLNNLMDLFNKNTPNQSNALFGQLSQLVSAELLKSGLAKELVAKISSGGLDEILKIFQSGTLGNLDMNTVNSLVQSLGGSGGIGGLLGNLGGLFGKK
jgi:hypothetical protein